ncbi:DUF563 domain-containing protein [Candidatus Altiarchaeota archaeon]
MAESIYEKQWRLGKKLGRLMPEPVKKLIRVATIISAKIVPGSFRNIGVPKSTITCDDIPHQDIYPPDVLHLKPPKTVHEKTYRKHEILEMPMPGSCVIKLRNGISSPLPATITAEGKLLFDASKHYSMDGEYDHSLFSHPCMFPDITHHEGSIATITSEAQDCYYHWIYEVLPRIHLIKQAGIKVDQLYTEYSKRFQQETLEILGYNAEDVIPALENKFISADELIVTSIPCKVNSPNHWICKFLRDTFIPQADQSLDGDFDRIYVSRPKTIQRKVINEDEVYAVLKEYGFRRVFMEDYDFRQQVKIFNSAKVIVAPHGAALTNIIWCEKGTKLIEFASPKYISRSYWILSNLINIDYYYFFADGEHPADFKPEYIQEDINCNISRLKDTLKLAGL